MSPRMQYLFAIVADGSQQEAGMAGDLLVVAKLDDEIAVAVAEEVEVAILQERLDHAVAEALDETHAPVSRRADACRPIALCLPLESERRARARG